MNQFFRNNAIGSVNGPSYGTVGGGSFLVINGQSVTASSGLSSVAAAGIKVIAVDKHGKELESFSLPTGTSINIDVHVDTSTYVDKITSQHFPFTVLHQLQRCNAPTGRSTSVMWKKLARSVWSMEMPMSKPRKLAMSTRLMVRSESQNDCKHLHFSNILLS